MGKTTAINQVLKGATNTEPDDNRLLQDGAVVGDWRILALIGKGGNGEIYRAKHIRSGAIGALKVLTGNLPHHRKRFDLELEILQKIASYSSAGTRHFPHFLDKGTIPDGNIPYLVIEFLQKIEFPSPPAPPMEVSNVKKLLLEVSEGLRELHQNGYLHRDIKPENLMCRENGDIVLIDFGCAVRIEDIENPLTKRISVTQGRMEGVGTEGSTAPEQWRGHASVKSDVYALGALASECFCGKPPANWGPIIAKAINPNDAYRYGDLRDFENDLLKVTSETKTFDGFLTTQYQVIETSFRLDDLCVTGAILKGKWLAENTPVVCCWSKRLPNKLQLQLQAKTCDYLKCVHITLVQVGTEILARADWAAYTSSGRFIGYNFSQKREAHDHDVHDAPVAVTADAEGYGVAELQFKRLSTLNASNMPFPIYKNDLCGWHASGYLGDEDAKDSLKINNFCYDNPHSGVYCMMVEHTATDKGAGVCWQNPSGDWGEKEGGANLVRATALVFWARGETGGEKIGFFMGGCVDKMVCDTTKRQIEDITLTKAWTQYRMSLEGADLSRIKTAFGFWVAAQGKPVTFYLDDIVYICE